MATFFINQTEAHGNAMIGLSIMCLVTLLAHVSLNPHLDSSSSIDKDGLVALRFFSLPILSCIWVWGLGLFAESLAAVSILKRNQSLIFGLVAANISLASWLFFEPCTSVRAGIAYTIWLFHVGLAIGAFLGSNRIALPFR